MSGAGRNGGNQDDAPGVELSQLIGDPSVQPLEELLRAQGFVPLAHEPLCRHGTWRIGGPADLFVEPSSRDELGFVLRLARECGVPSVVIGKGSNLLFDDAGLRGIAIKIGRRLSRVTCADATIRAEAGVSTPALARLTALAGLTGLEHIVGIPGTLGGLVVMNGGSLQRAVGDTIIEVQTLDRDGRLRTFCCDDCAFAYRSSRFQGEDYVVTDVAISLSSGSPSTILSEMREILRDRRRKFPLTWPNCGSVFKSDPSVYRQYGPPGAVVERLGLKGLRVGGATVDRRHANFIVNTGRATSRDVLALVLRIRRAIQDRLGCSLACEVKYVRPDGVTLPLDQVLPE